jgi:hypothetical protein
VLARLLLAARFADAATLAAIAESLRRHAPPDDAPVDPRRLGPVRRGAQSNAVGRRPHGRVHAHGGAARRRV